MLRIETVGGDALRPHIPALARLRQAVFREWPYLYDGDEAYEAEYLATYAVCPRATLVIAWDGPVPVGLATCLPLLDETPNVVTPFRAADLDPADWFYFGESVLLRPYRGQGAGVAFFQAVSASRSSPATATPRSAPCSALRTIRRGRRTPRGWTGSGDTAALRSGRA